MDDRVGPVAVLVEEAAERVLHRAGGGGEDVGLDRGEVDDVLADEAPRDAEALGVDLVQAEELLGEVAHRLGDGDPGLALVEVDVAQAVRLDDVDLLVLALAQVGVDDHGAVVAGVDQVVLVAVRLHRADDALELPRRGRGRRVEEVPGDVDLEPGVGALVDHLLVVGEVHHPVVVLEDRGRAGADDGDFGTRHGPDPSICPDASTRNSPGGNVERTRSAGGGAPDSTRSARSRERPSSRRRRRARSGCGAGCRRPTRRAP